MTMDPKLASGIKPRRDATVSKLGELPRIDERLVESYGGASVRTNVAAPADRDELRAILAHAKAKNWSVTFRGGGHAFDTQSLNTKLVVSLRRLRRIDVDVDSRTVTAEAGATWGTILAKTKEKGLVPHVMVTTHTASAGGTLSSNSLSRFSPTLAREGQHVARFSLMLADGRILECSRESHPEHFWAVIGGLGYVGAILEVTHKLLPLEIAANDIAVATTFMKVEGFQQIADALLSHVRKKAHDGCHRDAVEALTRVAENPRANTWAVSAVVYMQKKETGLIATSHYTAAPPAKRHRSVFHSPNSIGAWTLQIAALFPVLREIGYSLVIEHSYKEPKSYVDDLEGYTFFEDGNRNLRTVGRALGFPMGIHQHTFVIPYDVDSRSADTNAPGTALKLASFLHKAKERFGESSLTPTLIDVLYLPDEGTDPFLLSSSRKLPGFAVTFTFEKPLSARFDKEKAVLRGLVDVCTSLGGRVHLPKNVDATPEQIASMYGDSIAKLRQQHDSLVSNEFLKRVLPELDPEPRN